MPLKRNSVSLALISEKRAQQKNLKTIPGVDKEVEQIVAVADMRNVEILHQLLGSTTIEGTSAVMQETNMVHLACHGIQDLEDATQSGFCLGDGRLTIAKLIELKLDDAFLAFLSACETAKGDKEQPDQAMHLAAAMLFSGFKSVIATMWYVDSSIRASMFRCSQQAGPSPTTTVQISLNGFTMNCFPRRWWMQTAWRMLSTPQSASCAIQEYPPTDGRHSFTWEHEGHEGYERYECHESRLGLAEVATCNSTNLPMISAISGLSPGLASQQSFAKPQGSSDMTFP
jgi:hypothetical protein